MRRFAPEANGCVIQKVSQLVCFSWPTLYIGSFVSDFLNSTSSAHVGECGTSGAGLNEGGREEHKGRAKLEKDGLQPDDPSQIHPEPQTRVLRARALRALHPAAVRRCSGKVTGGHHHRHGFTFLSCMPSGRVLEEKIKVS